MHTGWTEHREPTELHTRQVTGGTSPAHGFVLVKSTRANITVNLSVSLHTCQMYQSRNPQNGAQHAGYIDTAASVPVGNAETAAGLVILI